MSSKYQQLNRKIDKRLNNLLTKEETYDQLVYGKTPIWLVIRQVEIENKWP